MSLARQTNIDVIRVVSLLIVIIAHYELSPFSFIAGTQGVVLFFFVSGYCIAMTTERRKSFWDYWRARLVRLMPVLVLSSVFITIMKEFLNLFIHYRYTSFPEMFNTIINLPFLDIPYAWDVSTADYNDYMFADGAFWSLLVEFRFYFLFGLIFFLFRQKRRSILLAAPLSLLAIWTSQNFHNRLNDFFLYLIFFSFGAGYYYFKRTPDRKIGLAAMVIALLCYPVMRYFEVVHVSMAIQTDRQFWIYAPLFVVFILMMEFVDIKDPKKAALVSRLGLLTYPAYLIHQDLGLIIMKYFEMKFKWPHIPLALVCMAGVYFMAVLIDRAGNALTKKLKL